MLFQMMDHEAHMAGMGFYMGWGWVIQIAILILFFLVVFWLIKGGSLFGFKTGGNESAADILNKRLAKGEISKREYQELKREIGIKEKA